MLASTDIPLMANPSGHLVDTMAAQRPLPQ
jgi:hypothetical protein